MPSPNEINNSILRADMSIGTFSFAERLRNRNRLHLVQRNIRHLKDDDDEKVIESLLLRERIYVEYLNNTHVYALKNSGRKNSIPNIALGLKPNIIPCSPISVICPAPF